jgi:hypothetical protein
MIATRHIWQLLVVSLPGANQTLRMRVWRALKASGAAALRDGVYLLPVRHARDAAVFAQQAREVRAAGGTAYVLPLGDSAGDDPDRLAALFDRSDEYAGLLAALRNFTEGLAVSQEADARRQLAALRRDFAELAAIDFFPGPAHAQVDGALSDAEAALNARFVTDEPHAASVRIRRCDPKRYRNRVWATRARPWIDRIACAWLIRRFIDPKARFLWLKKVKDCPRTAVGFDFDGAEFSHEGARVTFETLSASFDLDRDPALSRLGALVHYLDIGGVPVAEAAGFAAIMAGARTRLEDDDRLLDHISEVLDHLYAAYAEQSAAGGRETTTQRVHAPTMTKPMTGNPKP